MQFDDSVPLYYQIENILRERIAVGRYSLHEPFATEAQLIEEFQVSRITVRTALAALAQDGLISRRRGKGTIVAGKVQHRAPTRLRGFIEDILTMVQKSEVKVLDFDFVNASTPILNSLRLKLGERPLRVEKIRLIDNEPFSHVLNYVPPGIAKRIRRKKMEKFPLLQILESEFGIRAESGGQEITASIADPRLASLLNVMVGAPLLKIERTVYDVHQHPIEYVIVHYRADRYSYSVNLKRLRSRKHGNGQWVVSQ